MAIMKTCMYLFALLMISSCSKELESSAKQQMEKTMKELAKDPSSVQISNIDTKFSNDSICIIHFKASGTNGFGGVAAKNIEYVYILDIRADGKKETREIVIDLDKDKSKLIDARDNYEKYKDDPKYKTMTENEKKAHFIYDYYYVCSLFNGRKIGANCDEIENW